MEIQGAEAVEFTVITKKGLPGNRNREQIIEKEVRYFVNGYPRSPKREKDPIYLGGLNTGPGTEPYSQIVGLTAKVNRQLHELLRDKLDDELYQIVLDTMTIQRKKSDAFYPPPITIHENNYKYEIGIRKRGYFDSCFIVISDLKVSGVGNVYEESWKKPLLRVYELGNRHINRFTSLIEPVDQFFDTGKLKVLKDVHTNLAKLLGVEGRLDDVEIIK